MTLHREMQNLDELLQIEDPAFYDDPYEMYARLRNEAPVHLYAPLNVWILSKHEDIRIASRKPEVFSNSGGILLNDLRHPSRVIDSIFPAGSEAITSSDPPRHRDLRRYIASAFSPRAIALYEDDLRAICAAKMDQVTPGQPVEWVRHFAAVFPVLAIAILLGLPRESVDNLTYWSEEVLKIGFAMEPDELAEHLAHTAPMTEYFREQIEFKRREPGSDLISALIEVQRSDATLTLANILMLLQATLVGGNQTTRELLVGSILTFAENPDQWARLKSDPSLVNNAVEECLRWITPVRGFIRTLLADYEFRGRQLRRGDHALLLWAAANRDEEVFSDAERFDITRRQDPAHIAFGIGEHGCPGSALARLELRLMLQEMAERFDSISLARPPVRAHSVLHNAWDEVSVVLSRPDRATNLE